MRVLNHINAFHQFYFYDKQPFTAPTQLVIDSRPVQKPFVIDSYLTIAISVLIYFL
jgi:hypothetical protein